MLLFLSLALLPIGLIAVVQTRQISDQARANAELSLLAVTERMSAAEERVLQEAFGAAEALGTIVALRRHDHHDCSSFLRQYEQATGIYSLVGFVDADGMMRCSSMDQPVDFSDNENFNAAMNAGKRRAAAIQNPTINERLETVVNTPVFDDDVLVGVMAISIPYSTFAEVDEPDLPIKPIALMTFSDDGKILTSEKRFENVHQEIPADVSLAAFSGKKSVVFDALNADGVERVYAVLPLVPNAAYAISVWSMDTPFLKSDLSTRVSVLLPVVMWVASLIVAFWALNRLAITHIRKLGRQMRRFALNRTLPRDTLAPSVPTELVEMERAFIDMGESILRDEATLEDSLREKNILLKEVHHRVKNNLQLISSIMNMQIRQAKGEDAKFVLRRLQDRILSLATVHENMYQNDDLSRVDAKVLLQASVNQLLALGLAPGSHIKVTQNYEKITLDPDDAAPLTLLTSEAVTNALKYVSAAQGKTAEIGVDLSYDGPETARLTVENTAHHAPETTGTGLGSKLILAFTRQLTGQLEVTEEAGTYRMTVTFPVPQHQKPVHDY